MAELGCVGRLWSQAPRVREVLHLRFPASSSEGDEVSCGEPGHHVRGKMYSVRGTSVNLVKTSL